MARADFFAFLQDSLACLAAEEPQAHRALADAIGPMRLTLVAGGDARTIRCESDGWTLADREVGPTIEFDHQCILDLVDGRVTLHEAIAADRLRMSAPMADLERLHAALLIFIEGMLRAPAAPSMLERYRHAI